MGELKWAAYAPPTADQLERQQRIRDRIERLSVRPIRDTLGSVQDMKAVRVKDKWGLMFVAAMVALLAATLRLLGWLP